MTDMHKGNELIPGLVLPPGYHGVFRKRLTEIGCTNSAVECRIARARAEGLIEALELLLTGVPHTHIESLYILVEKASAARLAELQMSE